METDETAQPIEGPSPPKKAKKAVQKKKKDNEPEKADYAGLEVKKGASGKLQRPRHSGAKIRARDKGTSRFLLYSYWQITGCINLGGF